MNDKRDNPRRNTILIEFPGTEEEVKSTFEEKYKGIKTIRKSGPVYTFVEFHNPSDSQQFLEDLKDDPKYKARLPKDKPKPTNKPIENKQSNEVSPNSRGFEEEKNNSGSEGVNNGDSIRFRRSGDFRAQNGDKPRPNARFNSSKPFGNREGNFSDNNDARGRNRNFEDFKGKEGFKKQGGFQNQQRFGADKKFPNKTQDSLPKDQDGEDEEWGTGEEETKATPNSESGVTKPEPTASTEPLPTAGGVCNGTDKVPITKELPTERKMYNGHKEKEESKVDKLEEPKGHKLVFIKDVIDYESIQKSGVSPMVGVLVANFPITFMQCDVYSLCNPYVKVLHVDIHNDMTPFQIPFAYVFVATEIIADHLVKMINGKWYKGKPLMSLKISDVADPDDIIFPPPVRTPVAENF